MERLPGMPFSRQKASRLENSSCPCGGALKAGVGVPRAHCSVRVGDSCEAAASPCSALPKHAPFPSVAARTACCHAGIKQAEKTQFPSVRAFHAADKQ